MNVFAKFDEIPSMILEVIKETKRYRHTVGRTVGRRSDNVKTVYPPTNTVCRGYNNVIKRCSIVTTLSFKKDRPWQTMQTQQEQSDKGLHSKPFYLHHLKNFCMERLFFLCTLG